HLPNTELGRIDIRRSFQAFLPPSVSCVQRSLARNFSLGLCLRSLRQCVEQRFRLLQIARVEALSEPAVHRSEQFASLLHLALVTPKAGEAHGGAEFPGLCLLLTGDGECAVERDSSQYLYLQVARRHISTSCFRTVRARTNISPLRWRCH